MQRWGQTHNEHHNTFATLLSVANVIIPLIDKRQKYNDKENTAFCFVEVMTTMLLISKIPGVSRVLSAAEAAPSGEHL